MALEPITRQEKIIAGQDLTPITRMEKFLKNFGGGGGSIPKPLTYDYMPEGYPKKEEYVTLMEEQEVAFSDMGRGDFAAISPVALEINKGDKLTVVWDGVSYDVVVKGEEGGFWFGNQAISDPYFEATDEPFLYWSSYSLWHSADTATTHTIKVMRQQVTYTPIDVNFIPNTIQRVGDDIIISSSTPDSTKKFKITVDDSGTIKATEVT